MFQPDNAYLLMFQPDLNPESPVLTVYLPDDEETARACVLLAVSPI